MAYETMHLPVLFEGGGQWGLSLGAMQRFTLSPVPTNGAPSALFVFSKNGSWQFSPLYLRAPVVSRAVFLRRTAIGLHGGAGFEERAITFGYSSITATVAEEDATYELEFSSRSPLDSKLLITPATKNQTIVRTENNAP